MCHDLPLYSSFILGIKELIYRRQYAAMKKVNTEFIELYWEIGGEIVRQQCEKGWGNRLLKLYRKSFKNSFPAFKASPCAISG
jgi:hypothetical protein